MPRYDYECPKCKQVTEVEHGILYAGEIMCGKCKVEMVRLISAVSGWVPGSSNPCGGK
jgi:putative FmdB family regulatory protein